MIQRRLTSHLLIFLPPPWTPLPFERRCTGMWAGKNKKSGRLFSFPSPPTFSFLFPPFPPPRRYGCENVDKGDGGCYTPLPLSRGISFSLPYTGRALFLRKMSEKAFKLHASPSPLLCYPPPPHPPFSFNTRMVAGKVGADLCPIPAILFPHFF